MRLVIHLNESNQKSIKIKIEVENNLDRTTLKTKNQSFQTFLVFTDFFFVFLVFLHFGVDNKLYYFRENGPKVLKSDVIAKIRKCQWCIIGLLYHTLISFLILLVVLNNIPT